MNLRAPYQHSLSEAAWKKLYRSLKKNCDPKLLTDAIVHRKAITYGYKVLIALSGYRPGLHNSYNVKGEGLSKEEWETLSDNVTSLIKNAVPDAEIKVTKWNKTGEFHLTWRTYLQTRQP